jgi:hypothetical protein
MNGIHLNGPTIGGGPPRQASSRHARGLHGGRAGVGHRRAARSRIRPWPARSLSRRARPGGPTARRRVPHRCRRVFVVVRPTTCLTAGRHRLIVDPVLEDLAVNSLTRVFDRDLSGRAQEAFGPVLVGNLVRAPLRAGRLAVVPLRDIPSGWYPFCPELPARIALRVRGTGRHSGCGQSVQALESH